jgi:hypothetical protein
VSILVAVRELAIACAIAIVIGWTAPATAEGVGIVAVSAETPDRAAVASAMAGSLGSGTRIVQDAVAEARAAVAAGAVPTSTLERFRRVREAIDEGWRAFVRVQVELAASRLAVARTDAESLVAYPGGNVLYADAALRLGAVLEHQGRTAEGHAAISLALALDPDRPITLAEFSPDVVAAVDSVRTMAHATRSVRVTTEPAGATLAVDGKDLGRAPLDVDLSLGQHVVVARLPRHEPRALAIALDAAAPAAISIELATDPAATRLVDGATIGLADDGARELVEATLRFADLDEVVLVASVQRRGGPALLVQRCAALPVRCTAVVEVGFADPSGLAAASRQAWQATRSADLRYPPSVLADARTSGSPVDDRCKLCRSPILWGAVGGAALIGTIVIIAVVSGSRPPPVVGVDPSQF